MTTPPNTTQTNSALDHQDPPNPGNSKLKTQHSQTVMGRPTKCTKECRAALLTNLRAGLNYGQACHAIGICSETLRLWRRGDPALCRSIEEAEAQAVVTRLDIINQASQKNWRAAAWWLERKFPHIWGPTRNLTVEDKLGYARIDRSVAHEHELSPLQIDLRTALALPANAPDEDVRNALERAKINLMRSRAYGIPIDQLPK